MKTAVSIPDEVFEAAEKAAQWLRLSRSQLYTRALRDFLETLRIENVTEQLNQVYGEEESKLDSVLAIMQFRSLERDEW